MQLNLTFMCIYAAYFGPICAYMWSIFDLYVHICGLFQTYRCIYVAYMPHISAYMLHICSIYVHIGSFHVGCVGF